VDEPVIEEPVMEYTGFTLIAERQSCDADVKLGMGYPREEGPEGCFHFCQQREGCQFFEYDPNDGECVHVTTASADCPEKSGFSRSPYYDFYAMGGAYNPRVIAERSFCNATRGH